MSIDTFVWLMGGMIVLAVLYVFLRWFFVWRYEGSYVDNRDMGAMRDQGSNQLPVYGYRDWEKDMTGSNGKMIINGEEVTYETIIH